MKSFRAMLASFLVLFGVLGLGVTFELPNKVQRILFSCPSPDGYYNGSSLGENYSIGAFTISSNGNLKKCHKNPILSPVLNSWESRHVKDPYAIKVEDEVWLYYAATNGLGNGYFIGLASSKNGINFTRYEGNPLLDGSSPVLKREERGTLAMYYSRDPDPGIWWATSKNGLDWKEQDLFYDEDGKVLIPGDILGTRLYFGSRRDNYDVMRWIDVETKEVSEVLLNLYPCAVTPRGLISENLMYPTVYGCEEKIRETVAEFKNGEITKIGVLGTPEPRKKRWDAVSAENITWIR